MNVFLQMKNGSRHKSRQAFFLVLCVFVLSRVWSYGAGVAFDVSPLTYYLQYLDPALLRERLWESTYYMHIQPPLFNIFLGAILKWFPVHCGLVFQGIYLAIGALLPGLLFCLMDKLGVSLGIRTILTMVFVVSPSIIICENWLFYMYPILFLLVSAAVFLYNFVEQGQWTDGLFFFACLAALVLVYSVFHLLWFLLIFAFVFWRCVNRRQKVLLTAIGPFLVLCSVSVKNFLLFGILGSGFFFLGINAAIMTVFELPVAERERLIQQGHISQACATDFYQNALVEQYRQHYGLLPETGIPALDQKTRSTGFVNYNNQHFLHLAHLYWKDALYVARHYPEVYGRAVQRAFFVYFLPGPTDVADPNRPKIATWERIYNFMFIPLEKNNAIYSQKFLFSPDGKNVVWNALSILTYAVVVFVYVSAWGYGCWRLARKPQDEKRCAPQNVCLAFICFSIFYVTCVSNLFANNANNRYRLPLDPFYVSLLGLMLTAIWNKMRFGAGFGNAERGERC